MKGTRIDPVPICQTCQQLSAASKARPHGSWQRKPPRVSIDRSTLYDRMKKYAGEGFPPDHIVWDGLADNTNPMPDGRYKITLSLTDAAGEVRKAPDAFVNIQSILPLGVSPVEVLE